MYIYVYIYKPLAQTYIIYFVLDDQPCNDLSRQALARQMLRPKRVRGHAGRPGSLALEFHVDMEVEARVMDFTEAKKENV